MKDNELASFNRWYKRCKATGCCFQEESKTDLEIIVEYDLLQVFYKGNCIAEESCDMEPEDVSFTRDLAWVPELIKTVYELGKKNNE